jgi:8-oxo-dGTP pyrophosphatase MutT (NUDIX family)
MDKKFNIRVYGILIRHGKELLVTDEFRLGMLMTKFPGGGLEFGEGTIDCLVRECREEFGQAVKVLRHFYTTDYFQATDYLPVVQQLISIYYLIEAPDPEAIPVTDKKFDFEPVDGAQTFRWVEIMGLEEEEFSFPIDRRVLGMIKRDLMC